VFGVVVVVLCFASGWFSTFEIKRVSNRSTIIGHLLFLHIYVVFISSVLVAEVTAYGVE
jgi:hypothetical protein